MKKNFLLIIALMLTVLAGQVSAKSIKTSFNLSNWTEVQNWGLTASYDATTNVINFEKTGEGDWTSGDLSLTDQTLSTSDYDRLVVEVGAISDYVKIQIYQTDVDGIYIREIAPSEANTTITIPMSEIVTNDGNEQGTTLSTLNKISFFAMGAARTIEVKNIYLEKDVEGFVTLDPSTWSQLHGWGATAAYDATTKAVTITTNGDGWNSASYGATELNYSVDDYSSLVLEIGAVTGGTITLHIKQGDTDFTKDITTDMANSTVTINMSELKSFTKDDTNYSISSIDRIHFEFMSNTAETRSVVVNDIYFTKKDATAISKVIMTENAKGNNAIYDMQGRRVSQPTKPGLYISNGKKFVVK